MRDYKEEFDPKEACDDVLKYLESTSWSIEQKIEYAFYQGLHSKYDEVLDRTLRDIWNEGYQQGYDNAY